ncbi:MAG: PAS domain-containing protein [Cytophagaceae bacterium]|nr:PAS domain-containing protein [Cytophagaceae bacterium]
MQIETTPNIKEQFLSGGGEMGQLTREKDWSETVLGPTSQWPQSLRTTLSILLSSKFPMFLFWGPELIQFYNDAYRPSLGKDGKHPTALGQRGEECWKEIWHYIGPIIDRVRAGGEASWDEDKLLPIYRNGKMEDVYWTFSYSPVKGESGNVNGVLVVCNETTKQIHTTKKLEVIDKKFRNTVKQAPVGIVIVRGADFTVELANDAYLQLVDRTEEQFVGKPILESLPEVIETIEPLLQAVIDTGVPFHGYEVKIPVNRFGKQDEGYFNLVYHPLRDENGEINGIMAVVTDVTQQVESKFALQESEKQFRNLVTQSPIPMAIFRGSEFVIEMGNEVMLKTLWHKQAEEVVGKKLLDIFPELIDQKFPALLSHVWNTGESYKESEALAILSTPEGLKKYYLDFEYAPLKELNPKTSGIMVTVVDVTEKVEARQVIKDSAERLKLATEGAKIATWDLDLKSRELIYSGLLTKIFGYEENHKITHQELRDQIHPEDIDILKKAYEVALDNSNYQYEARIILPNQSIRWIKTMGKIFYDNENNPHRMLGTIMDISERKRSAQILERSEKKFRTLADSIPQFIWTGDPEGNLNYFSQSVYDYSGLNAKEIEEKGWIEIVHADDKEENINRWRESICTGNSFVFEHRFRRYDGEYRWQMSRAIPQKDEEGKILMWVGTSTDIHDRKLFIDELEQNVRERTKQLSKLNADLIKSNDDLAQFAYVASHDLQEPLRKIQIFTTRIIDVENEKLSDKGKDYFARIQSSSRRMQQLILDLLSYSRVNAGKNLFEPTDLNKILELVKENMKEILEHKKAQIISSDLPKALIIPFQFEQLLTNLISNALKFSKTAEVPVITVKAEAAHRKEMDGSTTDQEVYYHHLSLKDNGIGFDPQYREKIFQVFQRLHGKDEYEGTGIGLSIVKKIVDNHNGIITVETEIGTGTTFHIYIPFVQ